MRLTQEQERVRKRKSREKHRKKYREWLQSVKAERGCSICPEKDPRCLQFHHLDPTQKAFNLAQASSVKRGLVLQEIAKCVVLCANCHFKLHGDNSDYSD